MTSSKSRKTPLTSLFILSGLTVFSFCAMPHTQSQAADVIWYDGKKAPQPRGSLLTNNPGLWGASATTAVTYSYPTAPDNPADVQPNNDKVFGKRLLDGQHGGDWHSPVGINGQPLVVDLDFHQTIHLSDMAVAQYQSRDMRLVEVEVKQQENEAWRKVFSADSSPGAMHLIRLEQPVQARYVRLRIQSTGNITYISQVWAWGEAQAPLNSAPARGLVPGIENFPEGTRAKQDNGPVLSPARLGAWRAKTGFQAQQVTWQATSPWQALRNGYLEGDFLPGKGALRQPVQLQATRDDIASGAVFLVNAGNQPQTLTVELSPFKDAGGNIAANLKSELFVAGSIWTRRWGHALRPLLSADNKPGAAHLEKYLTNSDLIKDFPTLHLPPGGTVMLWVSTELSGIAPGNYRATISTGSENIPIELQVQPLTLPLPKTWLRYWNTAPATKSNLWSDETALEKEMDYQRSLGNSIWENWPEEGNYVATAQRLLAEKDKRRAGFVVLLAREITDNGYSGRIDPENLGDDLKQQIRDATLQQVAKARELGLTYDDWSLELWDEPTVNNMKSWVAVARLIREADPQVQIYMNPLFWTREGTNPEGFVTDERQVRELEGWYNELVDISVPIMGQVNAKAYPEANKQFYNHLPRKVRAYFTHPNPGRSLSWEAFKRGYNGWGSYAYFAARRDPWNDFDHPEFDYQIVYPGPTGFIPTIESESMRQSWQDFRVLSLLQEQGKDAVLKEILDSYEAGIIEIPSNESTQDRDRRSEKAAEKLPALRQKALEAALR